MPRSPQSQAIAATQRIIRLYADQDWRALSQMMSDPFRIEYNAQRKRVNTCYSASRQIRLWKEMLHDLSVNFDLITPMSAMSEKEGFCVTVHTKVSYHHAISQELLSKELHRYHFHLRLSPGMKQYQMHSMITNLLASSGPRKIKRRPLELLTEKTIRKHLSPRIHPALLEHGSSLSPYYHQ